MKWFLPSLALVVAFSAAAQEIPDLEDESVVRAALETQRAAQATRRMIESMDLPAAEKEAFLAQIEAVETIQSAWLNLIDQAEEEESRAISSWSTPNSSGSEIKSLRATVRRLMRLGEILVGEVRVIDGDTLQVEGKRIRLHGIDAPEMDQRCLTPDGYIECGYEAKQILVGLIAEEPVWCRKVDIDRYDRIIAVCESDEGQNLNQIMVERGWALAYRDYSTDYVESEEFARLHERGLWEGDFDAPWDWRAGDRRVGGQ